MGALITPTYTPFCVKSLKGNPFCLCKEAFSRFFPEPFPRAITTAAPATATATTITAAITATATGGTPTRVKVFPFKEIFQKLSSSISLLYYLLYGNINIFLTGELDRLCGLTAPGPLYFLCSVLIQRILRSRDGDLLLIGYDKSLCSLLYELYRWMYLFGCPCGRRD